MIPVVQSIVRGEGEDGPPGDCLRACVASIFELPIGRVPHFVADPRTWLPALAEWLEPMGLAVEFEEYDGTADDGAAHPRRYHEGWWIASVTSERFPGGRHAVVMHESRVAWDPSPHPRAVPYGFRGERYFVAANPAAIARVAGVR